MRKTIKARAGNEALTKLQNQQASEIVLLQARRHARASLRELLISGRAAAYLGGVARLHMRGTPCE